MVLRRQVGSRVHLTNLDRLFLVQFYHWFPSIRRVLAIVRPETVVRWHRAGFRCNWRWKSRSQRGRPQISGELRALIRRMSSENPLWGAPRIHGGNVGPDELSPIQPDDDEGIEQVEANGWDNKQIR